MKKLLAILVLVGLSAPIVAQQTIPAAPTTAATPAKLAKGSKIYIEPMDGFETYLSAAFIKKNVPLVIVDTKEKADFIITGTAHVEKAGWAKTIFISGAASAAASITIKDAHTGDLAFAYSVDKYNSARQNQSTAEACAKHIKSFVEKK